MLRLAAIILLGATAWVAGAADEEVKPPRPSTARVQALIEAFESDKFADREKAQQELRILGFHYPDDVLDPMAERWFSVKNEESSFRLYSSLFNIKHDLYYKDPIGFVGISMLSSDIRIGNRMRDSITIREIVPGTAAERARLQVNDRILSVDGLPFDGLPTRTQFFSEYVKSKRPGDKIEIEIVRGAEILTLPIELGKRPKHYQLIRQDRQDLLQKFNSFLDEQRQRLGLEEPGPDEGTEKPPKPPQPAVPPTTPPTVPPSP